MTENEVIIVGGGFAGVRCALDLSKKLPKAKIMLLNDTPFHGFHADMYEVAGALVARERKKDFMNLRGTVSVPLLQIFKQTNVHVQIQKVTRVDLERREVTTQSETYHYTYLVLALGSVTNYFHVTGAEDYGKPFKTTEDALNIHNDIEELVLSHETSQTIVIAGAGFTGVELAGSLSHFLKQLAILHNKPHSRVVLIGSREHVLEGMPMWSRIASEKQLHRLGVITHLNHRVESVNEQTVVSTTGEPIPYDYLVWATGISGNTPDNGIVGVEMTIRNQIVTQPDLSLREHPEVFVLGDLAECMDSKHGCPVTATAWSAIDQGKVAARNIELLMKGQTPLAYIPNDSHFVVPVGRDFAVSDMYGKRFVGKSGWLLKRYIALSYFASLLPFSQAFKVWRSGVSFFTSAE